MAEAERDPRAMEPPTAPETSRRRFVLPLSGRARSSSEVQERKATPWAPEGSVEKLPEFTKEQEEEIERLFAAALAGELPRTSEPVPPQPERLNERSLLMVMSRASGLHQRMIAKAYGESDGSIHAILNHPDAKYLLAKLLSMRAVQPRRYQERFKALSEPAMSSIEDVFFEEDPDTVKVALKKASLAFKILEFNDEIAKPQSERKVQHEHRFNASPEQLAGLSAALRESREVRDAQVIEFLPGPDGTYVAADEGANAEGLMLEQRNALRRAVGGGD